MSGNFNFNLSKFNNHATLLSSQGHERDRDRDRDPVISPLSAAQVRVKNEPPAPLDMSDNSSSLSSSPEHQGNLSPHLVQPEKEEPVRDAVIIRNGRAFEPAQEEEAQPLDFSLKSKPNSTLKDDWTKPGSGQSAFEAVSPHTPWRPGPFFGSTIFNPGRSSPPIQPPTKVTRPFKAYNPNDPLASALQLSNPPGFLPPPDMTFLAQYRQYLLNAQAALFRAKSNTTATSPHVPQNPPQMISKGREGSLTPSPPQVTSTSDPHFEVENPQKLVLTSSAKPPPLDSGGLKGVSQRQSADDSVGKMELKEDGNDALSAAARRRGKSLPDELKDEAYWERRRKNNEAAKRSRDSRRQKEDEIAMRAAILEQENIRLRLEVQQLKTETEKLRQILLNS